MGGRRVTARRPDRRRRLAGVGLAAVCLVGLGMGSAAQTNVGSGGLGSGVAVVGDCQGTTAIRAQLYTAWVANQGYRTTGMRLHGVVAGCGGQTYRAVLVNAGGQRVAEVTGSVPTGGGAFDTPTFTAVDTALVDHVEIVITT